jgi:hypothetical protein
MKPLGAPEFRAIGLGAACYLILAGWMVVTPAAIALTSMVLGHPAPTTWAALPRYFASFTMLFLSGYVTGRAIGSARLLCAALLGIVLFALLGAYEALTRAVFNIAFDETVINSVFKLLLTLVATTAGGAGAQYHAQRRSLPLLDFATLPPQRKRALIIFGLLPYAVIALLFKGVSFPA